MDDRGPAHRPLPPGDAAHADRADAPDHADLRVAQRGADLRAEVAIDDLGVLVDEHERLEVVALGDRVEHQVVAAEIEPAAAVGNTSESGSAASADPRLARSGRELGVGDGGAEDDHRARPSRRRSQARGDLRFGGGDALAQRGDLAVELELAFRRHVRGARARSGARLRPGRRVVGADIGASASRRHLTHVESTLSIGSAMPCSLRYSSTARRHASKDP